MVNNMNITITSPNTAIVESRSHPGEFYHVDFIDAVCDCPANYYKGLVCQHIKDCREHQKLDPLPYKVVPGREKKVETK